MTFKEYIKQTNLSTSITVLNCSFSELSDLNGIEEFKCLKHLDCSNNNLTSLPDLSDLKGLKGLYCDNNNLTSLPDLSELQGLERLVSYNNNLPYDLSGLDIDEQIILINRHNNINTILLD